MTSLEKLHQMIFDADIDIVYADFNSNKKSMCFYEEGYKGIGVDKASTSDPTMEHVLLAEEMGHFETGALYHIGADANSAVQKSNRRKHELRAKSWAFFKIIPPENIQKIISDGYHTPQEIAEHCNVPVEFLCEAMAFYEKKGVQFKLR